MAIFCNDGIDTLTQYILGKQNSLTLEVRLFTNDETPDCDSIDTDFNECVLAGYAGIALDGTDWTGGTVTCASIYDADVLTFIFDAYAGGTTIYGYYVMDTYSDNLIWAEKFTSSYLVPTAGGSLDLYITYSSNNC